MSEIKTKPSPSYRWGLLRYQDKTGDGTWFNPFVVGWFRTQKSLLKQAHVLKLRPGDFAVARYTDDFDYSIERGY
jgi:hypothetical protein